MLSCFSCVLLFETPWAVALQAPLSMGFSCQEYWSRFSFLSPGDLPNPGIEPMSHKSPALAGGFFTTSITWEAQAFQYSAFQAVEVASFHVKRTRMLCKCSPQCNASYVSPGLPLARCTTGTLSTLSPLLFPLVLELPLPHLNIQGFPSCPPLSSHCS